MSKTPACSHTSRACSNTHTHAHTNTHVCTLTHMHTRTYMHAHMYTHILCVHLKYTHCSFDTHTMNISYASNVGHKALSGYKRRVNKLLKEL